MKPFFAVLAVLGLSLCGCESTSEFAETVRTRAFTPREEPRSQSFAAPQREVYEAVLRAAKDMDFRFVRGGPAEGSLEEISRIETDGSSGGSRQISLRAKLDPTVEGGTQVTAAFGEILEADSAHQAGVATETPLRDTSLYAVFFRGIQQQLIGQKKATNATPR